MSALSHSIHPNPALYLSPEFIAELALGMDPVPAVCARHGVEYPRDFDALSAQAWFGEMVARKRMELQESGVLFSAKAGMMAEELWQHLYKHAITGQLAHPLVVETAKHLTEIAGLKPKGVAQGGGGGGPTFQLNINVSAETMEKTVRAAPVVVEGAARDVTPAASVVPTLSIPLGDPLPPKPAGFRMPDFTLTRDLTGSEQAQAAAQSVRAQPA